MTSVTRQADYQFVSERLRRTDRVWLWRSFWTPTFFAIGRVSSLSAVSDSASDATHQIKNTRAMVIFAPPEYDHVQSGVYDLTNSRSYIESYTGKNINVVIIDGIAPIACARQVAECAQFGPTPETKIFLLGCDDPGNERIYTDGAWGPRFFDVVERQGSAMLMRMAIT